MTKRLGQISTIKWALLVLVAGLILTAIVAWQLRLNNERDAKAAVDEEADRLIADVVARLTLYQYGLRGAAGAIVTAGEHGINREIFQRYSQTRDYKTEFPGARGFGFIRRVPEFEEEKFVKQARLNVASDFSIRQLSPHKGERYVIEYLEPLKSNGAAIGLDIASEMNRRTAAELSMRTGKVALTGPITLVQEKGKPLQSFLMLFPIYRGSAIPQTTTEREDAALGWSYAPLIMADVLRGLHVNEDLYRLSLRDVTTPGSEVLFYETSDATSEEVVFNKTIQLDVFGRRWESSLNASPRFFKTLHQINPHLIFFIGMTGSLLLAVLTGIFSISQQRKKLLALEKGRLATIVENSSDAIVGAGLDGNIIAWNRGAEKLFGYSESEALGKPVSALLIPPDRLAEHDDLFRRIVDGQSVPPLDTVRQAKNSVLIDVTLTAAAILEADGSISGVAKLIHDIRDRKAAETRLREFSVQLEEQVIQRTAELDSARRSLQTILDAVPSLIGYWDSDVTNQAANRAYGEWFGVDPASLKGTHLRALIGNSMYELNIPYIEGVLRGEEQVFERTIKRPDGKGLRHSLAHYLPDIVDGEVQGFYAVVHDVSDLVNSRLQLADAMRENEVLLRTINEQMLFSVTDTDGVILEVNENFCRASGYDRDELLGNTHRLISSGLHSKQFWRDMWLTIGAGRAWHGEISNLGRTGNLRWFDTVIAPFKAANGEIERYVALRMDITRRKAIEAQSSELNLLLRNVLRSASEISIIATDTAGLITIFNAGAQRMMGYEEQDVVGKHTPVIFHLEEEVLDRGIELSKIYGQAIEGFRVFVHVPETEEVEIREWTYCHKNGHLIRVSLTVTAMRDDEGKITGYLGVAQDIGKRKEFEGHILRAKQAAEQASVAKGQFLANMSHEIRTPMNAVLGMLQLLKKTNLEFRQLDYVDKAFSAGSSLLGLLNDILDFSKIEAGKLELDLHMFDFEELMQELAIILCGNQGEKPVEILFDLDPTLPPRLIGDKLRLQQILINLAGNALKFTERGYVIVSIKMIGRVDNKVRLNFSIQDTGIGMTEEQRGKIFNGFSQAEASISRRFGGSGLGLIICKRLISLMDGELAVESSLGLGSCFSFQLLMEVDECASKNLRAEKSSEPLKVLVVDDNPLALEILAKTSFSLGWDVETATGGQEAIIRNQKAVQEERPYDVILMDWRMPDLDGLETAKKIHQENAISVSPVVIMISAYGREVLAEAHKNPEAPFVDFLTKPITPRQLGELVNRIVNGSFTHPIEDGSALSKKRLAGMRLLVVEDNALNRQVAAELLGGEGAYVSLAGGGLQGIEILFHGQRTFDVVIMDVQMPDIDGLEATRRIRSNPRFEDIPILAMTANASISDREACLNAGMTDHVGKPFDLNGVVATLLRLTKKEELGNDSTEKPELIVRFEHNDQDVDALEKILIRLGGNMKLFRTVVGQFQKEGAALIRIAEHEMDAGNVDMASAAMHSLKGISATAGAKKLATYASEVEQKFDTFFIHANVKDDVRLELKKMNDLLERSSDQLTLYLPAEEQTIDKNSVLGQVFTGDEWRKKLEDLKPILAAGNLSAIELIENMGSLPSWIDQSKFDLLYQQIQELKFIAAITTLVEILEKA